MKILLLKIGLIILIFNPILRGQCLITPAENFLHYQTLTAHGLSFQSAFGQNTMLNSNCGTNFYFSVLTNPDQTTATVQAGPLASISVFPNPVADILTIQWKNLGLDSHYEMINVIGSTLLTGRRNKSEYESTVNLSSYPSGIYLLKIYSANHHYQLTYKIIKP